MGTSLTLMTISGLSTLLLVALFAYEERRGSRFGEGVRSVFDRMLTRMRTGIRRSFPEINDHFFQELFYFVANKTLSVGLKTIRRIERGLLFVVRFNRMQIARIRLKGQSESPTAQTSGHLVDLADHKRATELSPKEKAERKEDAIGGFK